MCTLRAMFSARVMVWFRVRVRGRCMDRVRSSDRFSVKLGFGCG
jgi:hypothetical protein